MQFKTTNKNIDLRIFRALHFGERSPQPAGGGPQKSETHDIQRLVIL